MIEKYLDSVEILVIIELVWFVLMIIFNFIVGSNVKRWFVSFVKCIDVGIGGE